MLRTGLDSWMEHTRQLRRGSGAAIEVAWKDDGKKEETNISLQAEKRGQKKGQLNLDRGGVHWTKWLPGAKVRLNLLYVWDGHGCQSGLGTLQKKDIMKLVHEEQGTIPRSVCADLATQNTWTCKMALVLSSEECEIASNDNKADIKQLSNAMLVQRVQDTFYKLREER